jgi:hypothetical protein
MWFGVWLTSWVLLITLAQPVNLALATESAANLSTLESVSVIDTIAEPVDCLTGASRPNISLPLGTQDSPFKITSFEDLQCMEQLVNNNVEQSAGNLYRTGHYWQFSSFDAHGETLNPIGHFVDGSPSGFRPFSGTITGAGTSATISNLKIQGTTRVGLFGVTDSLFLLTGVHFENLLVTLSPSNNPRDFGSIIGQNRGSATISNCSISGTVSAQSWYVGGLVGYSFTPYDNDENTPDATLTLDQVSFIGPVIALPESESEVAFSAGIGGLLGAANSSDVLINNAFFEGNVGGAYYVGGLAGSMSANNLEINNVGTRAIISSAQGYAGGLIGNAFSTDVFINNAFFEGELSGNDSVGGLLGSVTFGSNFEISNVATRAIISNVAGRAGGLIGTYQHDSGSVNYKVNNAVVLGSISTVIDNNSSTQRIGGLVGSISIGQVHTITISSVILAVELFGAGNSGTLNSAAGLFNGSVHDLVFTSVLNLSKVASSLSGGYDRATALVLFTSGSPNTLTSSHVYQWQGLSASASTYHPFPSGIVKETSKLWRFNGEAVNCSNFSDLNFWTSSDSMNLKTTSGWDFSKITSGYLPTLNGHFPDQEFTCMNDIAIADNINIVKLSFGFGLRPLPVFNDITSSFVHYFSPNAPTTSGTRQIAYRFETSGTSYYDIFYDGMLVNCGFISVDDWVVPATDLLHDGTISLRTAESTCTVPNFQFELAEEEANFLMLLQWKAEYTQSVDVIFNNFGNLAGGIPPGINATDLGYLGTANAQTVVLGPATVGTYTMSASGSILGQSETKSRPVAQTVTWANYLPEVIPIGTINFPDVFISDVPGTIAYKTIIYKANDNLTVSEVRSVNESRYAAIRWLASVIVTAGSQSNSAGVTTYRAQDPVNRGSMAQFLQKLAGFTDSHIKQKYQGQESQFTDLAPLDQTNTARYYSILWLADTKITVGCNEDGTQFCPGNVVSRGTMAEFMRKFAGVAVTEAETSPFPDVNLTPTNVEYDRSGKTEIVQEVSGLRMGAINWLATTGITQGSDSSNGITTYRPQDAVNRGAMAEFMYKLALLVGSTPV